MAKNQRGPRHAWPKLNSRDLSDRGVQPRHTIDAAPQYEPPLEETTMRFMLLMIPRGYEKAAPGAMPDAAHVAEMMKFNQAMQEAGIVLALDGLHPPSMGARVTFEGGKPCVTDGPFA